MEGWSWRGRGAGNGYPLEPLDFKRCRLVGSTTCERLNGRIRGNCDSLPRRIPVDPTIPAELDGIVRTVVTEVNPELPATPIGLSITYSRADRAGQCRLRTKETSDQSPVRFASVMQLSPGCVRPTGSQLAYRQSAGPARAMMTRYVQCVLPGSPLHMAGRSMTRSEPT